ncbi:hypothetical protein TWF718_008866 [Orbilia javanica]|uniref:Uncharacterized protein n=1 Tax=Orbilia javanica TaxID=47235 RepID=A0AAN8MV61_9PEZI
MQQDQHVSAASNGHTNMKGDNKAPNQDKTLLTLEELKEFHSSGFSIIPSVNPSRRNRRGTRKHDNQNDEEELEEMLAGVKLNENDPAQGDIVKKDQRFTPATTLSRASERFQRGPHPDFTRKYSKGGSRRCQSYTPRYQDSEVYNPKSLTKAQQRKLETREQFTRVQHQIRKQIDVDYEYPVQQPGGRNSSVRKESKSSCHAFGTRGRQSTPKKVTIMQRSEPEARSPSPGPPPNSPTTGAWLHEQSVSGPWGPLKATTQTHPLANRERRREHLQQVKSETEKNASQLEGHFADLETSMKEA